MAKITGMYNKTIYRNIKTGKTTFLVNLSKYDNDGDKTYICKGIIPPLANGIPIAMTGEKKKAETETYFEVSEINYDISDNTMLKAYIKACLPIGLGIQKAEAITELMQENNITLEQLFALENKIELIASIKGINKPSATVLLNRLENNLVIRDVFFDVAKYGISFLQADKLCKKYGALVKDVIKKDPYLALSYANVSFLKCDIYAREHGYAYYDMNRIKALVNLTIDTIETYGHTYSDITYFTETFRRMERTSSAFNEEIPFNLVLYELCQNYNLEIENDLIYSKKNRTYEHQIVTELHRLHTTKTKLIDAESLAKEKESISQLDSTQKNVIDILDTTDTCLLVGGPGTGKTTTIKEVIRIFKKYCPDKKYVLAAPTGRAAQRMKESSGEEAMTIHLLLEYYFKGDESTPNITKDNPLDVDFVILDEFSMVGLRLFNNLLSALKNGTKLLLVGDWNQLQSVEPGNLLHDIVNSGKFRTVKLETVHRQKDGNSIIENAKRILAGNKELITDSSYHIIPCTNNDEGIIRVKDIFLNHFSANTISDCFIMTPGRKGDYGVEGINKLIQDSLHNQSEPYLLYGNNVFYENERVMTNRNQYNTPNYYNGDLWNIYNIRSNSEVILKNEEEESITLVDDMLDDIELAYAMTVHKCQGSEAKTCIIFLPDGLAKSLINRTILYTAATRPKDNLYIITVNNSLEKFIAAPINNTRNTEVTKLIKEQF